MKPSLSALYHKAAAYGTPAGAELRFYRGSGTDHLSHALSHSDLLDLCAASLGVVAAMRPPGSAWARGAARQGFVYLTDQCRAIEDVHGRTLMQDFSTGASLALGIHPDEGRWAGLALDPDNAESVLMFREADALCLCALLCQWLAPSLESLSQLTAEQLRQLMLSPRTTEVY